MAPASILIADDSPLVLRMMQKMLEEAGFGVVTARDGLEAIEKAVAEDVRLVILDVMMPRMNGYQACRLLKTEPLTRDLPVVILTSRDQAGDRFWGLETGADYYITKDSEPHRILELVRNILAQRPAGQPRASAGRAAHERRHPLPRERAAGPQALRGHHPLGDRARGAQARQVRRDVHLGHDAGGARGGLQHRRHGVRGGRGPRGRADAPAAQRARGAGGREGPADGRPSAPPAATAAFRRTYARLFTPARRRGRTGGAQPGRLGLLPRGGRRSARGHARRGRPRGGPHGARCRGVPARRLRTRRTSSWRTAGWWSGCATSRSATA